jgi:hypothetical protein
MPLECSGAASVRIYNVCQQVVEGWRIDRTVIETQLDQAFKLVTEQSVRTWPQFPICDDLLDLQGTRGLDGPISRRSEKGEGSFRELQPTILA